MSFTVTVKNEAMHVDTILSEQISELSALLYNIAKFEEKIKISTENIALARFLYKQIKQIFDISAKITVRKGYNFTKRYIYLLEITKKQKKIKETLGLAEKEEKCIIPKDYIVEDEDLKRAYLRGLFLACGSINDPKTSRYHLEFFVNNEMYAKFIESLLNSFHLKSKSIKRENKYMVYIKEAEKISDFLRIIKTMNAVLYYEDIRIYRDHKNMTNRLNNCEQANVDKIIETAQREIKDIEYLKEKEVYDLLDDKIKEVASYRLKYKEVSLSELSEIISMETGAHITKSGVHHRMKKIKQLAEKVRSK